MWITEGTLHYIPYVSEPKKAIAFDLDWTLSYGRKALHPREAHDIHLMPGREKKLTELANKGWGFVIYTNQKCRSENDIAMKKARVLTAYNLIKNIGNVAIFMATGDDEFRKPNPNMHHKFKELYKTKVYTMVGDAAGRPQDHSDADIGFAKNNKLKFLVPENVFKVKIPAIPQEKTLIILMGVPGAGKTTTYNKYLEPKGYIHINQDTLKTTTKVYNATYEAMQQGLNICLDNTNASEEKRKVYYELADEYGYQVKIWYLVRDGYGWNKLRDSRVPDIAYHMYFKHLSLPVDYEVSYI